MAANKLYRAAADDYVSQGMSFARREQDARAYLDNPGFGGCVLFAAEISAAEGDVIDLRSVSIDELAADLETQHPGAIGVDEWIPRTQAAIDALRARGHLWAIVSESYPAGSETWIWLGDSSDDEPELSEVA